jgi:hypothetical protein
MQPTLVILKLIERHHNSKRFIYGVEVKTTNMKRLITVLLITFIITFIRCVDPKPSTKYSIYVPSRVQYGGGWYNTNSYKSFKDGAIEFRCGNNVHRATDVKIVINY